VAPAAHAALRTLFSVLEDGARGVCEEGPTRGAGPDSEVPVEAPASKRVTFCRFDFSAVAPGPSPCYRTGLTRPGADAPAVDRALSALTAVCEAVAALADCGGMPTALEALALVAPSAGADASAAAFLARQLAAPEPFKPVLSRYVCAWGRFHLRRALNPAPPVNLGVVLAAGVDVSSACWVEADLASLFHSALRVIHASPQLHAHATAIARVRNFVKHTVVVVVAVGCLVRRPLCGTAHTLVCPPPLRRVVVSPRVVQLQDDYAVLLALMPLVDAELIALCDAAEAHAFLLSALSVDAVRGALAAEGFQVVATLVDRFGLASEGEYTALADIEALWAQLRAEAAPVTRLMSCLLQVRVHERGREARALVRPSLAVLCALPGPCAAMCSVVPRVGPRCFAACVWSGGRW
jgi:hypothetical protein